MFGKSTGGSRARLLTLTLSLVAAIVAVLVAAPRVARADDTYTLTMGDYRDTRYVLGKEVFAINILKENGIEIVPGSAAPTSVVFTTPVSASYNMTRYFEYKERSTRKNGSVTYPVTCTKNVPVSNVTVSPTDLDLVVGGATATLTASVFPTDASQEVFWSSDDESVATVADGVVTAVGMGNAHIIATSATDGTKSGSCDVKVIKLGPTDEATMLRVYNPWSGEHLYTDSVDEVSALVARGWADEGVAWVAPASSQTPVYRLYNPFSGYHHYTTDKKEYDFLGEIGWRQEGVGFYSDDAKTVAVWRLFNPFVEVGTHHFTTGRGEYDCLPAFGWVQEGVGWYALR